MQLVSCPVSLTIARTKLIGQAATVVHNIILGSRSPAVFFPRAEPVVCRIFPASERKKRRKTGKFRSLACETRITLHGVNM